MSTDNLRDGIEAAFNEAETAVVDEPIIEEVESEKPEKTDVRVRDESGKFAKAEEVIEAKTEPPTVPDELIPAPQAEVRRAPSSWKKEAAAVFDKIESGQEVTAAEMKILRDEALKREGDFHKGIEGFKTHADEGRKFQQAMAPFKESFSKYNIDAVAAATELMKTHALLESAPPAVKQQKLLELAAHYGIDLNQQIDPNVARYESELHRLRQEQQEMMRLQQSKESEVVNTTIEQFAQQPGHEHLDKVRVHMASLLEGGLANTLQEAYDQAVYANPETRALLLQQQQRKIQDEANAKRAKAASSSVRGSSPSSGSAQSPKNSLRETIAAQFDNI